MKKRIEQAAVKEYSLIKQVISRFRRKDFSGLGGQMIKNSFYQLSTNVVLKFGSLLFTVILARILLPELFGLYSLALGTIIFFSAFSDLGIDAAMITFLAKNLSRKKYSRAKSYLVYLGKIKLLVTTIASIVLIGCAYFVARFYYQKPIFLALLAGGIYLPLAALSRFYETIYLAHNNFKTPFYKEVFFQAIRLILLPVIILVSISQGVQGDLLVSLIILSLSLCYLLSLSYLFIVSKKKMPFLSLSQSKLSLKNKQEIKYFIYPLTATVLSGIFFGYIDTIMLGRYVPAEYLGYYSATFTIVSSLALVLGFMITPAFSLFSQLRSESLRLFFGRVIRFSILVSLIGMISCYFLAYYAILIIYGNTFLSAMVYIPYFLPLIFFLIVTGVYTSYYISQGMTKKLSMLLILTTIVDIILNYFFIVRGITRSFESGVIGAIVATLISKLLFLILLYYFREAKFK